MKPVLFRILVILSAGIFLPGTENETFPARGGGRGGVEDAEGVEDTPSAAEAEAGWVEWEEGGAAQAGPRYRAEALAAADPGRYPARTTIEQEVWLRTRT
jgi:hypothetical protein